MSTQIVSFQQPDLTTAKRRINLSALETYCEAALPLLLLTVLGWYFFQRRVEGRDYVWSWKHYLKC